MTIDSTSTKSHPLSGHALNPWGDVSSHSFTNRLADFLQNGWPNPKQAGTMELFETRPERNIYKVTIYCDDMFICPTCGEFHLQSPTEDESMWFLDVGLFKLVDHVAIQQVIERRRDATEFSLTECGRENCAADRARVIAGMKQQEDVNSRTAAFNAELVNVPQAARTASFSKHSPPKKAYVYALRSGEGVKIGHATSVKNRVFALQIGSPNPLSIINAWEHYEAPRMERLLHRKYQEFRISREWFRLNEEQIQRLRDANRIEDLIADEIS